MKPDISRIRLTVVAAEQAAEKLEKAIVDYDHRAIGRELYNVRRELSYLKQLTDGQPVQDRPVVNADLVAAAPELLESLQALFEHCAMIHKHWGDNDNSKQADQAIKNARAAIQKATGIEVPEEK